MDSAYELLRQYFGYDSFRSGQKELIDAQTAGRDVFGIMPTGGGKSLCYQIPALQLDGITLVISPLISLMKDQVEALEKAGIPAACLNSSLSFEQSRDVCRNIACGRYKILYVAPERLLMEGFLSVIGKVRVSLVAVDEAHCISQWGQDFRPGYLKIVDFLGQLPQRPVVSAFTATATEQVCDDVIRILGLQDPLKIATGFDRPNLRFEVLHPRHKTPTLLELIRERHDRSGIVYCSTRKNVEKVCDMLLENGISATKYHAGMEDEDRKTNQEDFIYDRRNVIVATNAFGMGIDKSNVAYVIHYNMPQSMEAYYQEAGRAGRDGSAADCILLYSPGDIQTARYLIEQPQPNDELTPEQRAQIRQQDLRRLDNMVGYCKTVHCLRAYILSYFAETYSTACGNCGNCGAEVTQTDITTQAQMILSCVKRIRDRLGYGVGAVLLVHVLCGGKEKRIVETGLDTLSTYGLMRKTPRSQVREMVEVLQTKQYLYSDPITKELLLTQKAAEVLFHGAHVTMFTKVQPEPAKTERRAAADVPDDLLAELKSLRFKLATQERVPAYIVFSNATLQDMAAKRPANKAEFLQVSGVGTHKAERYADAFLAVIETYESQH